MLPSSRRRFRIRWRVARAGCSRSCAPHPMTTWGTLARRRRELRSKRGAACSSASRKDLSHARAVAHPAISEARITRFRQTEARVVPPLAAAYCALAGYHQIALSPAQCSDLARSPPGSRHSSTRCLSAASPVGSPGSRSSTRGRGASGAASCARTSACRTSRGQSLCDCARDVSERRLFPECSRLATRP